MGQPNVSSMPYISSKSRYILISICAILLVLIIGGITYAAILYKQLPINIPGNPSKLKQVQTTASVTPSQSVKTSTEYTITDSNGVETFNGFGITFHYSITVADHLQIKVVNDKIYLYPPRVNYDSGALVQVFPRNSTDTLEQSIINNVLSGYNLSDCPIKTYTSTTKPGQTGYIQGVIETGAIFWNANNLYTEVDDPIGTSKCPIRYTQYEGANASFLLFSNHPNEMIFLGLGAYGVDPADNSNDGQTWVQSITLSN